MTHAALRDRWNSEATFHGILNDFQGESAEDFFATGEVEVERFLSRHPPRDYIIALDFGCGMGRLTNALSEHFNTAIGVDVSPIMVEKARYYDQVADYRLMDTLEIPITEPVDFLVSTYVLQHIPTEAASEYLASFPELLAERGIGAVQITTPPDEGCGVYHSDAVKLLGQALLEVDAEEGFSTVPFVSRTYYFSQS